MLPSIAQAVDPLPINDPPVTGQIIVFPARDFVSASGWGLYPLVDVEVFRANPAQPGAMLRIGYSPDVVPQDGLVEVNHPGGACWQTVTPNIIAGDVVRLTGKDATGVPQVADQTTTANVLITQTVSQIAPGTVEVRGTALQANGAAIDAAQLEVRLIGSSADRFDFNGRRDLRAPRDGGFAITPAGEWVATFNGLTQGDVDRAIAAENRVVWLGRDPALGTEATIQEVGPLVAPGPAAPCTAPLQGAVAAPNRTLIDFPATDIGTSSAPEIIHLANAGAGQLADLVVSGVSISGDDAPHFAVVADGCTGVPVPVGGGCDIAVTFAPSTAGLKGAIVQINSNAGNTNVSVNATGLAVNAGDQIAQGVARPAFLGFATRTVGNASPQDSIEIKNIGNAPMENIQLDMTGATQDFAITSNDCTVVAPAATCTIGLTFTPSIEGDRLATLGVTYTYGPTNTPGAPIAVPLNGGGLVTVGLLPIDQWGAVNLGVFTARDFVSVGGFDPDEVLTMQIIRHGVVVGFGTAVAGLDGIAEVNHPGGGCWEASTPNIRAGDVLRVTRTNPTRIYEMRTADIKVTNRSHVIAPNVVEINGYARDLTTGGPIPSAQLESRIIGSTRNPFAINGRRAINSSTEGTLTMDPISATNPDGVNWTVVYDFSTSPDPAHDVALALSEENRILWLGRDPIALSEMTFWEDGAAVANGPSAPCTAPAQAPSAGIAILPVARSFPATVAGGQSQRSFTVRNIGDAQLDINSVTFGGANPGDFQAISGVPASVAPDGTATIQVAFTPGALSGIAPEARTATVRINDNAIGSPHTATVAGVAVATAQAAALATPSSVSFADTKVGVDSGVATVTVVNEGGAPLAFTSLPTVSGPFRVDQSVGGACALDTALNAAEWCTVSVIFTPTHVDASSGSLQIDTNDPVGALIVPLTGVSSTTADGTFDPPRRPHDVQVFPVRDYVATGGYAEGEFVRVDVYRNGALLAQSLPAQPQDVDPGPLFNGFVEVNHVGGVCWDGATPDIVAGDVVRAVRLSGDGLGTVLGADQTHTMGLTVSMPATQVSLGVVVMTGTAVDPATGLPLTGIEPRITSTTTLFDSNGRRDIRGGLDGVVTRNGAQWTVTFAGLSPADVQRAVTGDSKVVWLGRDPLALTELTHWEWGEIPGPDPTCAPTAPFGVSEPVVAPAALNVGYSGLAAAAPAVTATFTNPGPTPVTPQVQAVVGLNAGDFQVSSTTCGPTLVTGQSCLINVVFTASTLGTRVGAVPITHDGANGVSYVTLKGIGVGVPTITSATSPVGRGSIVHIIGTNLISTTSVQIGGVPVAATVLSDTAVDVTVPADTAAAASVSVVLVAAGGSASTSIEVLPDQPTITNVTPTSAKVGDTVTITGTNFLADPAGVVVTFNGVAATVTSNTGTVMVTTVPIGATTGLLRVANKGGAATAAFTVVPAPRITSFAPVTARRGAAITINGANFVAGQTTVDFTNTTGGLTRVATTSVTTTQIRVTVPNAAVQGPVVVTVNTPAGLQSTSAVFTVELAPTVSSLSPNSGIVGQAVTIRGNNFLTTSKVAFNGRTATFTIVSPTEIRATVPGGATTGTIAVGNKWGSTTSAVFTVIQPPTITSFTPSTVTATSRVVTVTGTSFSSVSAVSLVRGTTVIPMTGFTILSATQIRFTVPATGTSGITTGLYTIRVTNPAGTTTSAGALTVSS